MLRSICTRVSIELLLIGVLECIWSAIQMFFIDFFSRKFDIGWAAEKYSTWFILNRREIKDSIDAGWQLVFLFNIARSFVNKSLDLYYGLVLKSTWVPPFKQNRTSIRCATQMTSGTANKVLHGNYGLCYPCHMECIMVSAWHAVFSSTQHRNIPCASQNQSCVTIRKWSCRRCVRFSCQCLLHRASR